MASSSTYNLRNAVKCKTKVGGRLTRSMTTPTLSTFAVPPAPEPVPSTSRAAVSVNTTVKDMLALKNMLNQEMQERELISALTSNEVITIPGVDQVEDLVYDSLYPVTFKRMPPLIVLSDEDSSSDSEGSEDEGGNLNASNSQKLETLKAQVRSRGRPVVLVEKIVVGKYFIDRETGKRFRVRRPRPLQCSNLKADTL